MSVSVEVHRGEVVPWDAAMRACGARELSTYDRVPLQEGIARRLVSSFDVVARRASERAVEIVETVADLHGASLVADAGPGRAVLVPRIAADGTEEIFVAGIAWPDVANGAELATRIWDAAAAARLRLRVALAPDEHELVVRMGLPHRVTCVYVRTPTNTFEPSPLVRAATPDDRFFVQDLLRIAYERGFAYTENTAAAGLLARALANEMLADVTGPSGICLLACEDAERLGHVSGVITDWDEYGADRFAEMYDIFVTAQGRSGLGTVLERAFHTEAARRGADVVEGNICPTHDPRFVPDLVSVLERKGWREHRRLVVVDVAGER
jgi:hypothetical protein